jgi:hypothetical protein
MNVPRLRMRSTLASALLVATAGCVSLGEPNTGPNMVNTPVVGAAGQGVGFQVVARNFTFDQTYAGPAVGDSLGVGLYVSSYGGGSALIEIVDSTATKQLQLPVSGNVIQAQSTVHGVPPYTLHVQFSNFSGVLVLGVGVNGS